MVRLLAKQASFCLVFNFCIAGPDSSVNDARKLVLGAATKGCGHSSITSQTSKILNGAVQGIKSLYSSIPSHSTQCGFTQLELHTLDPCKVNRGKEWNTQLACFLIRIKAGIHK